MIALFYFKFSIEFIKKLFQKYKFKKKLRHVSYDEDCVRT